MDFSVEEIANGITHLVLRGRLDTTAAVLLELPFHTVAAEKRAIVCDLSAVDFLCSYGLRVLLMGAKIAEGKGGRLVIVCPDNNVAKVLRAAGTADLIAVYANEQAAVAAFAAA